MGGPSTCTDTLVQGAADEVKEEVQEEKHERGAPVWGDGTRGGTKHSLNFILPLAKEIFFERKEKI